MKAKLTKVLSLVLVVIMAMGLMTGCSTSSSGKGTKTQDGNKVLFSYDGTDVTLKEAWLYAKMLSAQYEQTYSSYYGSPEVTSVIATVSLLILCPKHLSIQPRFLQCYICSVITE